VQRGAKRARPGSAPWQTGRFEAGRHEVSWDSRDSNGRAVASGVYLARLTASQGVVTRKMTLLR